MACHAMHGEVETEVQLKERVLYTYCTYYCTSAYCTAFTVGRKRSLEVAVMGKSVKYLLIECGTTF